MNDPQPTTDEERPRARSAPEVADDVVARVLARASRYDGTALQSTADGHTPYDGDTVFALATGAVEVPPAADAPASFSPEMRLAAEVGAAAADCVARAVLVGVFAADSIAGIPTYRDVLPGAFPR